MDFFQVGGQKSTQSPHQAQPIDAPSNMRLSSCGRSQKAQLMDPYISQGEFGKALVAPSGPWSSPAFPSVHRLFHFRALTSVFLHLARGVIIMTISRQIKLAHTHLRSRISLLPRSPSPTSHNTANIRNGTNRIFQGRCARSIHSLYTIPVLTPCDRFASRPSQQNPCHLLWR
jgi:hypothetical protein